MRSFLSSGTNELLAALALASGESETLILTSEVRPAQRDLERVTTIPFFVTRFATRVLAASQSWGLGTDFDRYESPLAYDRDAWRQGRCTLSLPWLPLASVNSFVLALSGANGTVATLPSEWVERNDEKAELYVIPHGNAVGLGLFSSLAGLYPYSAGGAGPMVPALVHLRYAAGLVQLPADPADWRLWNANGALNETDFFPELVTAYQLNIAKRAAAGILKRLATELDNGGVSIGLDGLSEQINPGVLEQRATGWETQGDAWGQKIREQYRGMILAFA